jgi:uncharacterized protein YcgL (UPF0745 family)
MKIQCEVYKSSVKENLYIYVEASVGLSQVPEDLLNQFGEPVLALTFILTEQRGLAKEDPKLVMSNLNDQGYHLQLPPSSSATRPLFPPSDRL